MRTTNLTGPGLTIAVVVTLATLVPWADIPVWGATQAHGLQHALVRLVRATRSGDPAAIASLCLATATYGFVHALGPGHGKVLLAGAALASGASLRRMIVLSVVASLAQAACAMLLVASLLQAMDLATSDATQLGETWLAPLGRIAIAAIGLVLVLRGVRVLRRLSRRATRSPEGCSCGHDHGISLTEVQSLHTPRDVAALVAGVAIRPCTGALAVLVVAAGVDVFAIGVLATLAMGLGTALFNVLSASSGVAAHHLIGRAGTMTGDRFRSACAGLHIAGGLLVLCAGALLFGH